MTLETVVELFNAKRSGKEWKAKCPAHDDHTPSLSIAEGRNGCVLLNCRAGCTLDEILAAVGLTKRDLFLASASASASTYRPQRDTGKKRPARFDWQKCIAAFTDEQVEHVAKWRGYSPDFVRELRDKGLIGIHDGLVAFRVENHGKIVGAHVRSKDGNWFYAPDGINAAPLVFGNPGTSEILNVFESTWDGLDYMDKGGERDGVIITRGSSNGKFAANLAPQDCMLRVWTQNDAPGAKWESDIVENTKCAVKRVTIPAPHKDLNDWTRNGATVGNLIAAMAKAETLREPSLPPIDDGAKLVEADIDLPPDVIEGVVHAGGKAGVGGGSKSYKTWFFAYTAICIATALAWLGKFPTKRGRVLYINFEIQRPFFAKRIRTICQTLNVKLEAGWLDIWNLRGYAQDSTVLLPELLRRIKPGHYALIIIDPVYKILGKRDENKAGDIASLLNELEKLAVNSRAAVAYGSHYSKGSQASKEAIDRVSGSGVWSRDPDTLINFTRLETEDCFAVEFSLRNHPKIEKFAVRWDYPLFVVDDELNPDDLKQPKKPSAASAKPVCTVEQLLPLLERTMFPTKLCGLAMRKLSISESSFWRTWKDARASKAVLEIKGKGWKRNPKWKAE